jgi:hypothetical protein
MTDAGDRRAAGGRQGAFQADGADAAGPLLSARDLYAIVFGLFLGLSILKLGNPVVLEQRITPPATLHEAWVYAWPARWGEWLLAPLALVGAGLGLAMKARWRAARWLWMLPAIWLGWQFVSGTRSVDDGLTGEVLLHFGGCVACYFLGALVLGDRRSLHWLLIGLLAGFTICLIRATNQRLFEFPQERQLLIEGERMGWTNFAPDILIQLKRDDVIVTTNGMDVANPVIMAKYAKGRVHGTLVYPNALAGAVLLLWPISLVVAVDKTRRFTRPTRTAIVVLAVFLGLSVLFWTGSKLGWLVSMALAVVWLLHLRWRRRLKWTVLGATLLAGSVLFVVRFHGYFAAGATSAGARLDYWRAALQITEQHPWAGSGPGTFQRPYARLKSPAAEMAKLAHNDYLEQFSDSGIIGGISYLTWILLSLAATGRWVWPSADPVSFAIFIGLLGWFMQGLGEFSLYIPALAWTAFALLGWLVGNGGTGGNQIDKRRQHG